MASPPGWARVLLVFLVSKAIAVSAMLAGLHYFFTPLHDWTYLIFLPEQAGPFLAFINWDGQNYLKLAVWGYPQPVDATTVFFPLFPALISVFWRTLEIHPIFGGIVVGALLSFTALLMLERLLPLEERGPSSLWLLACYPTAFYLSAVYAEGLFLTALFGLFWALRDPRRAPWALLFAAALPLTRGQGLWLAAPLAVAWGALLWRGAGTSTRPTLAAASVGYALGTAGYFGIMLANYGNPLMGLQAQHLQGSGHSIANLFNIPHFFDMLFGPTARFLDPQRSGLDKMMILLSFGALLWGIARGVREPFLLTAWACFAILPAMMGEGGGYARYSLLAWACFVVSVGPQLGSAAKWSIMLPSLALQVYLAYFHGANRWVA